MSARLYAGDEGCDDVLTAFVSLESHRVAGRGDDRSEFLGVEDQPPETPLERLAEVHPPSVGPRRATGRHNRAGEGRHRTGGWGVSEMKVTSCDGCAAMAPTDYNPIFAHRASWIHLYGPDIGDELDACSWGCLATIVAARIAEAVDA